MSCRVFTIPLSVVNLAVGEVVVCSKVISFCSSSRSCVTKPSDFDARAVGLIVDVIETGRRVVFSVDVVGLKVAELVLNVDVKGDITREVDKLLVL